MSLIDASACLVAAFQKHAADLAITEHALEAEFRRRYAGEVCFMTVVHVSTPPPPPAPRARPLRPWHLSSGCQRCAGSSILMRRVMSPVCPGKSDGSAAQASQAQEVQSISLAALSRHAAPHFAQSLGEVPPRRKSSPSRGLQPSQSGSMSEQAKHSLALWHGMTGICPTYRETVRQC